MSGVLREFDENSLQGDVLNRIAHKFRDGEYGRGPGLNLNAFFDDVTEYLRTYCYRDAEPALFKTVRLCLPKYWDVFIPPAIAAYNVKDRKPCLHEAISIAHKFSKVRDDIQHNKLLFEAAFIAIRYVLEVQRIGTPSTGQIDELGVFKSPDYPVAPFFYSYDAVRAMYTKIMYYEEVEGGQALAYKKPRWPEGDGLDEREKRELIHFGNLAKITLPLILNLKSKRKPVTHVIESLVGGNERKIQSGSGVTDFSRRRFTIFEDESGIMPISNHRQVIKPSEVVNILKSSTPGSKKKDFKPKMEALAYKSGLNNACVDIHTFNKKISHSGHLYEVETDEFVTPNERSMISVTEIKNKDGVVVAQSVKYVNQEPEPFDLLLSRDEIEDGFGTKMSETTSIEEFLGGQARNHMPIDISKIDPIEIARQPSLKSVLTLDGTSLDDFDLFSYDFADRLMHPDDEELQRLKTENSDMKIEVESFCEDGKNISHRGISMTRLLSGNQNDWNLINSNPEISELLNGLIRRQTTDGGRSISRLVSLSNPLSSAGWTRTYSNTSNIEFDRNLFDSNSYTSASSASVCSSSTGVSTSPASAVSNRGGGIEFAKRERDPSDGAGGGVGGGGATPGSSSKKSTASSKINYDDLQ